MDVHTQSAKDHIWMDGGEAHEISLKQYLELRKLIIIELNRERAPPMRLPLTSH